MPEFSGLARNMDIWPESPELFAIAWTNSKLRQIVLISWVLLRISANIYVKREQISAMLGCIMSYYQHFRLTFAAARKNIFGNMYGHPVLVSF